MPRIAPNGTPENPNPDNLIYVQFYPNQGKGFGYSVSKHGADGIPMEGYDRTVNMTDREGRSLSPSFAADLLLTSVSHRLRSTFMVPWYRIGAASGSASTPDIPIVLFPWMVRQGNAPNLRRIQDGAQTTEAPAASGDFASAALHDNGSGVPALYMGTRRLFSGTSSSSTATTMTDATKSWLTNIFAGLVIQFGGSTGHIISNTATVITVDAWSPTFGSHPQTLAYTIERVPGLLNKRTLAGAYSEASETLNHLAVMLVSAAGSLWATVDDYRIKQWTAGSDPLTATPGASIQVGTSAAKITALGAIEKSPIVFKEDGIYSYNSSDTIFDPLLIVPRHPDNFPFVSSDGAGGLWSATHDGQLVHIERFGTITMRSLLHGKVPGRDTPRGPIKDIAAYGDRIFVLMDGGYRLVQPSSSNFKVLKTTDNFATFTDYSANASDRSAATTVSLSALDTLANGDALLIGFDQPFLGAYLSVLAPQVSTLQTLAAAFSTGAGTWTAATVWDGTASNTQTMVKSGLVALDEAGNISTWVKATYNGFSKYWLRLTVSAALDSGVTLSEVALPPYRAAPALTSGFDLGLAAEAAGLLPKVLMGTIRGDTITWDDIYTPISGGSPAERIAITQLPAANSPFASLIVLTRQYLYQYALPDIGEPTATDYPQLARTNGQQLEPVFYPSAWDGGGSFYGLRYIVVDGREITEETDTIGVAARFDETNAWHTAPALKSARPVFEFDPEMISGHTLSLAVQLIDGAATDPVGPRITEIGAWLKPLADPQRPQPARTTPEVA